MSSIKPTTGAAALVARGSATANFVGRPLKTFDIEKCQDMLFKLERELDRYRSAVTRPDRSDHATNFVITAWQLADWVWASPQFPALKARIEAEIGEPLGEHNKWKYHRWVGSQCREIEYCRVVGTVSKHAEIRFDNPVVGTTVSLTSLPNFSLSLTASSTATAEWVDTRWIFKLTDDGQCIDVAVAFEKVLKFWWNLIRAYKIE